MKLLRSSRRWPLFVLALIDGFLLCGAFPVLAAALRPPTPHRAPMPAASGFSGWFSLLWVDPPPGEPGEPGPVPLLTDDQGRSYRLVFPEGLAEKLGGVQSLDQHRLSVQGEWIGRPGDEIAVSALQEVAVPSREAEFTAAGLPLPVAKPYALILCRFSDTVGFTPHPPSWYSGLMSDGFPGATHFWQEASYSAIAFSGSVVYGWYNLPRPRSYYLNAAGTAMDLDKLFVDATAAANADVYFPDFAGINILVNDNLVGAAFGTAGRLGNIDGVTRTWGVTWLPLWGHNPGILGHEMGHTLGLPHSSGPYKETYDSRWDVMSGGAYGNIKTADAIYGTTPTHPIAWDKDKLGYIPAHRKFIAQPGTSTTIALTRLSQPLSSDDYLMAQIFIGGWGSRFYTVELRQFSGYDAVGGLPGEAVVVHKVDTTLADRNAQVVDADGNGNPNDEGAMWKPGETFTDTANGVTIAVGSPTPTGMRLTISVGSDVPFPSVVTNTIDQGPGSLRNAILFANQFPGTVIQFSIPQGDAGFGNGVFTLQPAAPLPPILGSGIVIDGGTQLSRTGDTNSGRPLLVLNGARAGASASGLQLFGSGCQVRRLVINGFSLDGIDLIGPAAVGNGIQGCYIGVNAAGTGAVPNGYEGITFVFGATGNIVGGTTPEQRNVISGNKGDGLYFYSTSTQGNVVRGNFIGTNAAGTSAIPNAMYGIVVFGGAKGNTLGGTVSGAGNVISGNGGGGVVIQGDGTVGTVLQGNFIGTDATATSAIPNGTNGVELTYGTQNSTIGGLTAGAGNVIGGNRDAGILLFSPGTRGNIVQGNSIGTDPSGMRNLGNGSFGVAIGGGASGNTIGGTSAATGNRIAFSGFDGIFVQDANSVGNTLRANSIFHSASLGINLFGGMEDTFGVTANDPNDTDTGPSNLQNYPVITDVTVSGGETILSGSIKSSPGAAFALDFYANTEASESGFGEGALYLGSTSVSTDANGDATYVFRVGTALADRFITATATNVTTGDTSEFSQAKKGS